MSMIANPLQLMVWCCLILVLRWVIHELIQQHLDLKARPRLEKEQIKAYGKLTWPVMLKER